MNLHGRFWFQWRDWRFRSAEPNASSTWSDPHHRWVLLILRQCCKKRKHEKTCANDDCLLTLTMWAVQRCFRDWSEALWGKQDWCRLFGRWDELEDNHHCAGNRCCRSWKDLQENFVTFLLNHDSYFGGFLGIFFWCKRTSMCNVRNKLLLTRS